jgi:hypothetical protein
MWVTDVVSHIIFSFSLINGAHLLLERDKFTEKQREEFTRCYFKNRENYNLRLRAQSAKTVTEFDDIFHGMKESALRGIVYTAESGLLRVPSLRRYRPEEDPIYRRFEDELETDVRSVKRSHRNRPESAVATFRRRYGTFGCYDRDCDD